MRQVALRMITGGRLRGALAAFEIERRLDAVILSVPVGAPGFRRTGARGGPRGSFLLPDSWDQGMKPQPWHGLDVVMVHRFDDPWSTWRWLDGERQWTPGFYINLERRWVVGESTYDTDDLTLDVVVDSDGGVTLKDEHELDWAEREGIYTSAEAADIRATRAARFCSCTNLGQRAGYEPSVSNSARWSANAVSRANRDPLRAIRNPWRRPWKTAWTAWSWAHR